jgi:homoserine dehydrogenase
VRGILNGTSNFVITQIERGAGLDEALGHARARGLAEADCTRDLDGSDVAAKLAIVTWMSYGIAPSAVNVAKRGINSLTPRLIEAADVLGGKVRLIGSCRAISTNEVSAVVEPVVFPQHHAFAQTELEDNRIEVDLGWTSPLSVSGPGAGGVPTATAILGDLLNFAPRANDRSQLPSRFRCGEDREVHRWLVASAGGWHVFAATRQELNRKISGADVSAARLELPLIGPGAS